MAARCEGWLVEVHNHLRDDLIPFWLSHGVDDQFGEFLTYFDRDGRPTDESTKLSLVKLA
ncbi:MAG: hypothetical protein QGG73_10605 [Candidatus Hydrogenedentes bacterium]|nr:hypothetical protein [Candidatus Hydrogenedentota bacterium]